MGLSQLGTREVVVLAPDATVEDAVRRMVEDNVGSVVVVDDGAPCGIVTDRDVVLRVLGAGRDPADTPLAAIMSRDLVLAAEDCPPDEAAWRMREHKVRRLPVVDDRGRLHAIVTLDDLVGKVGALRADVAEILASFHAPYQAV